MDAAQALADLTEISSQIVQAVLIDADGGVQGATTPDEALAGRIAAGVADLVAEADVVREARGLPDLTRLEAATLEGSVFVVQRGGRTIAATTRPDPTVGLVFYDLEHCLRSTAEPEPAPPRRRRSKADGEA
jgi:predicted regulator of Ras-like GTPase activity (Roadblock/LC7/MglB family)